MITQSTPFTHTAQKALLSSYYNGSNYIGVQLADLNTASLPAGITSDPVAAITQISGSVTIPAKFFGAHCKTPATLASLAAAGVKSVRLRDTNTTWKDVVVAATTTFTFSGSTFTWTAHGLNAASHGFFLDNVGGVIPGNMAAGTLYYLTNVTANTFQISLTKNGTAISLTGSPSGTYYAFGVALAVAAPDGTGTLDQLVSAAFAASMDIIYDCTLVPTSISKDATNFNVPSAQNWVTKWLLFLKNQFSNRIKYFEVWNEPNTAGYFNGTTTGAANDLYNYAAWLFDGTAFHATGAKIISPSWNITAGATAMGTWLGTDGGNAKIDIVGCHVYRGTSFLACDMDAIDAYVTQAASNAAGKEVWITEVGCSAPTVDDLWRNHLYAAGKGIARLFWYDWDIGPGQGNMMLTQNATLSAGYLSMVTTCAGQVCAYVNRSKGRQIGASIGGTGILR